jgi:predicted transcriptional regulator
MMKGPTFDTGRALRKLQDDRGMSSSDIARFLGVSRQAVYKWRNGDSMKFVTAVRICESLGVSINEFEEASR